MRLWGVPAVSGEPGSAGATAIHAQAGVGGQASTPPGQQLALSHDHEIARKAGTLHPDEVQPAQRDLDGYIAPAVGPSDLAALPGPFTGRQLSRIDEALTLGSRETGLLFSLYVGALGEPTRRTAEQLAARLPAKPGVGIVLLAVSPGQRVLEIVTARGATRRLPNRVCALAALGMRAAFVGGDLTAGVINGLRMLADAAGADSADANQP